MHNKPLSKYYFISNFDSNSINKQDKNTTIIYRNYTEIKDINIIVEIKNFCKKKGIKFLLANNFRLAIKLNLDGVYLPSFNESKSHLSYTLKENFLIFGSAHNLKEIKVKELQKVQLIFISSIFKKNKNYLGINKFKKLTSLTKTETVALGGINKINRKKLKLTNCSGFAGISYFK